MSLHDDGFAPALEAALAHALRHLHDVNDSPVGPTATLAELRTRFDVPLVENGLDAARVVDEMVAAARGGITGSQGGRFFGWVIGGSLPAALAADWMTSAWDQNAGIYAAGPAASVAEEVAGKWLKELLGMPQTAGFALVTGCQMAHVTCLAVARHKLLADRGWDVTRDGLSGAPAIRVLTSTEVHGTTPRALRLLGMGEGCMEKLAADADSRLRADVLEEALKREPERPTIVVLQAGDLNVGAFDDFATLIPLAKKYNAWVHVDGAFGLWVAASAKLRHLLAGAERADSWTTDGHKWLNVPYDSGFAFVADAAAHRATMSQRSAYISHAEEARDQIDWTPEFSRRGRGFATYAAIRQLGRTGVEAMIDRCCAMCDALVVGIGALEGAEIVARPQINQGLLRFADPAPGATEAQHNAYTDRIIAAIVASGDALFSGTTWRGRRAMRVSVSSWKTDAQDVERVVRGVEKVLKAARD